MSNVATSSPLRPHDISCAEDTGSIPEAIYQSPWCMHGSTC